MDRDLHSGGSGSGSGSGHESGKVSADGRGSMGIMVCCEYRARKRRLGLARELMAMSYLVCPSPSPATTQCRPILALTAVSIERNGCLKRNLDRGDRGMCGTCTDALMLTTVFDRAFNRAFGLQASKHTKRAHRNALCTGQKEPLQGGWKESTRPAGRLRRATQRPCFSIERLELTF